MEMGKIENLTNRSFFVDESGDMTLFNSKGDLIIGNPGVSKTFMLGVAQISAPNELETDINALRAQLMSDPSFSDISSLKPERKKTALYFHAKDDHPRVREEVFNLLEEHSPKFMIILRRKHEIASFYKSIFEWSGQKVDVNKIYEDMLKRIFKTNLHIAEENTITIARRGKQYRTNGLKAAIERAQQNFEGTYGKPSDKDVEIKIASPSNSAGLQVADYGLWVIQRIFERNDFEYYDRYRSWFSLVLDLDDTREKPYGVYYSKSNPITPKKIALSTRPGGTRHEADVHTKSIS